jgi:purine-nucleoside phosphorylase
MPRLRPDGKVESLVVAAWLPELDFLRESLANLPARIRRTVVLDTIGVGLVEAAIGASRLLATLRPRAVILVGTAGLYAGSTAGLTVGDAVLAEKIVLLPAPLPGRHTYLPEIMPSEQHTSARLTRALRQAAALPAANVANPIAITRSRKAATFAAKDSACALENLEAFALARAAASAKIPFAAVLGIANQVGPTAHREWKKNAAAAAEAACRAVLKYLVRQQES